MFLSPAVSGAILSFTTIEATFFIDVITAIIGISITLFIPIATLAKICTEEKSQIQSIKEGFIYLKENGFIKYLLIFISVVLILISPSAFLTPLMVSRSFGEEVWRLSASEMTFSAGAAAGGILIAAWGGFRNRMHTTVLACSGYGLLMIGLGLSSIFLVYLICNFLIGITMPVFNAPITVLLQEKVEPSMQGRMFSLLQVSTSCALPFGMMIFGPMADFVRVETILVGAGILVCGCAIYAFFNKRFSI